MGASGSCKNNTMAVPKPLNIMVPRYRQTCQNSLAFHELDPHEYTAPLSLNTFNDAMCEIASSPVPTELPKNGLLERERMNRTPLIPVTIYIPNEMEPTLLRTDEPNLFMGLDAV